MLDYYSNMKKNKKHAAINTIDGMIQTRASTILNQPTDFKVTKFEEHRSTRKSKTPHLNDSKKEDSHNLFDIKRTRHEIINFGSSGFNAEDKTMAKILMAVRLGAKPPKNPTKNYKEIIAERKLKAAKDTEEKRFQQLGKTAQGTAQVSYKKVKKARLKKKLNMEISNNYGVVNPKIVKRKKK